MTRSAVADIDRNDYPSPWDARGVPLDLALLARRRVEALERYDEIHRRLDELKGRVLSGKAKIAAASAAGRSKEKVVEAERRLAHLDAELEDLKLTCELPCHVLELAHSIAPDLQSLRCPEGSVMSFDLPGSVRVLVALDGKGEEVPF